MGEEMRTRDYGSGDDDEEERVVEWEDGLPNAGDLTPLSQHLIPPELASAFSIKAEPLPSMLDVNRASQKTLSSLRKHNPLSCTNNLKNFPSFAEDNQSQDPLVVEGDEHDPDHETPTKDGSETRKVRRMENTEEADSAFRTDSCNDDHSARTLKRPRLVWTPQLHKRFVDVVAHLGIKNAVPKTIMQLMNVEGLTRENVASHLQKYRLYLKRMQGLSNEGPSSSDPLFASTPVPQSLHEPTGSGSGSGSGSGKHMPPMPYGGGPMPLLGMAPGHMGGMPVGNPSAAAYQGFEFHPYGMFRDQQRDWSGNRFGSMVSYYPKASNDK